MASELTTPGQSAGEKPEPCKVCQHPRGREGSVTAASTTLGTLRQTAAQGCVTCGIFASAIQTLVSKTGDVLEDDWRVCFEFQMSYLGDSLAAYVYPLGLHVSFFAVECSSPSTFELRLCAWPLLFLFIHSGSTE